MKLSIREQNDTSHEERRSARLILRPGETLSFTPKRERVAVTCISGCLHVTQAGDSNDYILQAGDMVRCASRGKVVVNCYRSPAATLVETPAEHEPRVTIEKETSRQRGERCTFDDRPLQSTSGSVL